MGRSRRPPGRRSGVRRTTIGLPAIAAVALLLFPGCDPTGDFVFGAWDPGIGHQIVLDASSGPSGENLVGTLKIEGDLFGTVGCMRITGHEAILGLDLSISIGENAQALVSDNGVSGDVIRLSPTGLPPESICDADLEPGPPQPGNFVVRDQPAA
jgi:hypothetical protein